MGMSPRMKAKKGRYGVGGLVPAILITSPTTADTLTTLVPVDFIGSAFDAENGDLSAVINWSSDIDGIIGIGATVNFALTTLGAHVITATVTDGTTSATDTINVTVV